MKKFTAVIFLFVAAGYSNAQDVNQRKELMHKVDVLLNDFMETSDFKEIGGSGISETSVSKYRNLFTENAVVYDDINPEFASEESEHPYQLKNKTVDDFIKDVKNNFVNGIRVDFLKSTISYSDIKNKQIEVAVRKNISGTNREHRMLENQDTLLLSILIAPDFSSVKIQRISYLGGRIKCINDKDNDWVIDEKDKCPDTKGPVRFNGCPDTDKDGVPDNEDACPDKFGTTSNKGCPGDDYTSSFNINAGVTFLFNNLKIATPALGDIQYDRLDAELSNSGSISYPKTNASSVGLFIELDYFTSVKKTFGIGIGLDYNKFSTDIQWQNFTAHYRSVDKEGDPYRRIVSISKALEKVESSYISIPVLLKFRNNLSGKVGVFYEFGPSLLFFSNKSDAVAAISYEGIYKTQDGGDTWIYQEHYIADRSDVLITSDHILALENGAEPGIYFSKIFNAGYDFALDKSILSSQKIKKETGIGGNLRIGISYYMTNSIALIAGADLMYSHQFKKAGSGYHPGDKTTDDYNSVMTGTGKMNYFHYGLRAGVKIGLN